MATAPDAPDAAGRNGVSRALVSRLLTAAAYLHPVGPIRLVETHISWVFLTGEYVYKVKKPVDLGFLDFSTLDRRRHSCAEEVRLNRRELLTSYARHAVFPSNETLTSPTLNAPNLSLVLSLVCCGCGSSPTILSTAATNSF